MATPSTELLKAGLKTTVKSNKQVMRVKAPAVPKAIKSAAKKDSTADLAAAERRLALHEATRVRIMKTPETKRTTEEAAELAKALKLKDMYTTHITQLRTSKRGGIPHTLTEQGM